MLYLFWLNILCGLSDKAMDTVTEGDVSKLSKIGKTSLHQANVMYHVRF